MCTVLSGNQIKEYIRKGLISINPYNPDRVQPNTYDVGLSTKLYDEQGNLVRDTKPIIIKPKEFLLGYTPEYFKFSKEVAGILHTRSSIGRMGLFSNNAGLIDAGWEGQITYELFNASDNVVVLDPNEPIAQVSFHPVKNADPYNGVYNGQTLATPSKLLKYHKGTCSICR